MSQEETESQEPKDEIISSYEMLEYIKQKKKPDLQIMSKIPRIDDLTDGFTSGELVVISGPTKNGKTTLGRTLTVNFCEQNCTPLWFTFEVTPERFLNDFKELPLFYMPKVLHGNNWKWTANKIIEANRRFYTRVVFIDHLHFLLSISQLSNQPSLQIGGLIRDLRILALKYGLIIFVMAHTTKISELKDMSYRQIRDSSFVAQESDTTLMIARKPGTINQARLSVELARRKGTLGEWVDLVLVDGMLQQEEKYQRIQGLKGQE